MHFNTHLSKTHQKRWQPNTHNTKNNSEHPSLRQCKIQPKKTENTNTRSLNSTLTYFIHRRTHPRTRNIFSGSEASICLAGPNHLYNLGLAKTSMSQTSTKQHSRKQPLFCEKDDGVYIDCKLFIAECSPIIPSRQTKLQYKQTDNDIPKLEQYFHDQFASTIYI